MSDSTDPDRMNIFATTHEDLLERGGDRTYPVRVTIEHGEFGKADCEQHQTLCDDAIGITMTHENSKTLMAMCAREGSSGNRLHQIEVYKAWSRMAVILSRDESIEEWMRLIASEAVRHVQLALEMIEKGKAENLKDTEIN